MQRPAYSGKDRDSGKDRLKPLSMNPLPLEDALRGAMQVPPPDDEAEEEEDGKKSKPGKGDDEKG